MNFSDLELNPALMRALERLEYNKATPIQAKAIPAIMDGRDLMGAAQTGTGKTAAFTLPMLDRLSRGRQYKTNKPRALVLTPTRELAAQVAESVREYKGDLSLRSAMIFGGVSQNPQIKALRRGVDIIVATPGRLLDHIEQGNVDLSAIEIFVLDEADRMLDMGFIRDIRKIMQRLPRKRQNLLFSATLAGEIRKLAKEFMHQPVEVDVAPRNATADRVDQRVVYVAKHQKRDLLSWMIGSKNWQQVLVFMRTKHGANRLARQLTGDGLPSAAMHGNKSQGARTRALKEFKNGDVRVLVATDVAARGLDIEQLPHVINFELPNVPADYVHRIGRTGRAGESGEAVSLVSLEERPLLQDITKLLGKPVPEMQLDNFHLAEEKPSKNQPGNNPAHRRKGRQKPRSQSKPSKPGRGKSSSRGRGRNGNRNKSRAA